MARPVTEPLLRALVGMMRERNPEANVLAIDAAPHWEGADRLDTDTGPVRIVPCVSVLAVRELLATRSTGNGEVLVILTDRDEDDLGAEVLARVWRLRLQRPSSWDVLGNLFRADRIDPALADRRWLVDLLVQVAPSRGYPPPPSGFLDADTAWRTFLRHGLRLEVERPTSTDLVRWAATDEARQALDGHARPHVARLAELLQTTAGSLASHLLRIAAAGRGADVVPLGLVCAALWGADDEPQQARLTAQVRFERPLGAQSLDAAAARAWGDAAERIVDETARAGGDGITAAWIARAEELLVDLDASALAVSSDVLPTAFYQRLMRAGVVLSAALEQSQGSLEVAERASKRVNRHQRARERERDRAERLTMALRLVRWLRAATQEPQDLAGAAGAYAADGAWVDAAREAIAHGETVPALGAAYGRLAELVDERRSQRDRTFAAAFAAWNAIPPLAETPVLPIERVLERLVAPVARVAPVLFIVFDGLSFAEAVLLFGHLRTAGWIEHGPGGTLLPIGVAAVPTVTVVSRASLLSGRVVAGGQDIEREGFESNAALRDASAGAQPRLFHKKDLKVSDGHIAPEVRDTVLDADVRIVGVVVNAVDDLLDKGSQIRPAEGLHGVRPLRPLLDAAAEAGRVIVIASDHGHILEFGSAVRVAAGSGERWRPADRPPAGDEVEIAGPRVLMGGGRIVAPATERVRYNPMEKRGYHGGATPQEALCPLAVLSIAGVPIAGWEPLPVRQPSWWQWLPDLTAVPPSFIEPAPVVEPSGQHALFGEQSAGTVSQADTLAWIAALLQSPVLADQRKQAGRQALDDQSIASFLRLLDAAGGVAPAAWLADRTGLPVSRLHTKLAALRRMLNVDAYPIITIESDGTVRLDRDLLGVQFQVEL